MTGADVRFVRIGRLSFLRRVALSAGVSGVLGAFWAAWISQELLHALLPATGLAVDVLAALGIGAAAAAIGLGIAAVSAPGLLASPDGSLIRIGRRTLPVVALTRAALRVQRASGPRQQLVLDLTGPKVRTAVWLRSGDRVLLGDDERTLLVAVLRASGIEAPRSPYDPTGRFTHVNFPGALTREEAVDLVDHVPAPGEPLPLTG